ncbi:MAG: hypothetical protein JJU28_07125 [Cyclobacteriaceae bacterium]|nr:hypothetical protein [Cyclobacteriaceae bacterium]
MTVSDGHLHVQFELKNLAYLRFNKQEEYNNIVGPYSLMYLITQGKGRVIAGNQSIELEPGYFSTSYGLQAASYK